MPHCRSKFTLHKACEIPKGSEKHGEHTDMGFVDMGFVTPRRAELAAKTKLISVDLLQAITLHRC